MHQHTNETAYMNQHIYEDLTRLRDELIPRAFHSNGNVLNGTLAEVV